MSAPRYHPPEVREYHCVSKCVDDQLLLSPTAEMAYIVARSWEVAQSRHDFVLAASLCMGNHGHDVVRPGASSLPSIMRLVKSQIARRANRALGRSGAFFAGRYHDTAILDAEASENAVHYAHANPVRAELVARAEDWLGFSTYRAIVEGRDHVSVTWFDEKRWRAKGAKESARARYTRTATVRVGLPLAWEGLSADQIVVRRAELRRRMEAEERALAVSREAVGREPATPERLRATDPRSRPERPKRRRGERAAGARSLVEQLMTAYAIVVPQYRVASVRFRRTGVLCPFPAGTYPPWIPEPFEAT